MEYTSDSEDLDKNLEENLQNIESSEHFTELSDSQRSDRRANRLQRRGSQNESNDDQSTEPESTNSAKKYTLSKKVKKGNNLCHLLALQQTPKFLRQAFMSNVYSNISLITRLELMKSLSVRQNS